MKDNNSIKQEVVIFCDENNSPYFIQYMTEKEEYIEEWIKKKSEKSKDRFIVLVKDPILRDAFLLQHQQAKENMTLQLDIKFLIFLFAIEALAERSTTLEAHAIKTLTFQASHYLTNKFVKDIGEEFNETELNSN